MIKQLQKNNQTLKQFIIKTSTWIMVPVFWGSSKDIS